VNELLLGALSALLSTNPVLAASNALARTTGIAVPVVNPADPVELEYQRLLAADDDAQAEADEWIKEAEGKPGSTAALTLPARIKQRFEPVEAGYTDFLRRHPGHTRARLAYASLLGDLGRYDESVAQMEKARELDPANPVPWNNLADHFSHFGPARKCLEYFAKAAELAPQEPLYRINLATAVAVFRVDARELFGLPDDQAVLRKALELYREARKLRPSDFKLATDIAQMYYLLEIPAGEDAAARARADRLFQEAMQAWQEAERLARDDLDREGVALHKARLAGMYGRFAEARQFLQAVSHPGLADLKARVARGVEHKEKAAAAPAN
jgi:tetratricopeptide (TPR) repeat protein